MILGSKGILAPMLFVVTRLCGYVIFIKERFRKYCGRSHERHSYTKERKVGRCCDILGNGY